MYIYIAYLALHLTCLCIRYYVNVADKEADYVADMRKCSTT